MMYSKEKIINCYNQVAENYAAERSDELSNKHFDHLLLKEFASVNNDNRPFADFGCGLRQTTKFLYDNGVKNIIAIDISSAMIMGPNVNPLNPEKYFKEVNDFEADDDKNLLSV